MNIASATAATRTGKVVSGLVCAASIALVVSLAATMPASAQSESKVSSVESGGIPLRTLIETVSKRSSKTFIIDPRVTGNASLVGLDASRITYSGLLNILQVHGFAAVEYDNIVRVIPDAMVRTTPTPLITGSEKRPDAEVVTRLIRVKSLPATYIVPILRSLLPQNAHLAAMSCTNELIIVDSYANVRRIEGIVAAMDKGDTLPLPKCPLPEPSQPQPRGPQPAPATAVPEK